ncbi:MAG TPA: hypothetical protein VGJ33_03685 [Candidatus Angelobacter sp.]
MASNTSRETRLALENMKKAAHAVVCKFPSVNFKKRKNGL